MAAAFFAFQAITPPAYAQHPGDLTAGLISCWDMDETSGTRYDAWGSNHLVEEIEGSYTAGLHGNALIDGYVFSLVNAPENFTFITTVNNGASVFWEGVFSMQSIGSSVVVDFGENQLSIENLETTWQIRSIKRQSDNSVYFRIDDQGVSGSSSIDNGFATEFGIVPYAAVDTTALWSVALTNSQLDWLYNDGNGRSCSDIIATSAPPPTETPTETPTPDPTETPPPAETPTPTPTPMAAAVYFTTLPSGEIGAVRMEVGAGEIIVASALGALLILQLFNLLQGWVMSLAIRRQDDD
jgi:hypothetical protein